MSPGTIDAMLAAGASAEVIAAAWKAEIKALEAAREERRTKDRDRQRRHRLSRDVTVTGCDNTGQPVTPSSDKALPQTPSQITTIPSPPFKSPSSQKRGTRLANDFEAPEDWITWAIDKRGWSREAATDEAEVFARYWQAKAGKDAVKLDWPKTWQNWVVNSRRDNRQTAPPVGAWDGMA
jgi:hypothetical protein